MPVCETLVHVLNLVRQQIHVVTPIVSSSDRPSAYRGRQLRTRWRHWTRMGVAVTTSHSRRLLRSPTGPAHDGAPPRRRASLRPARRASRGTCAAPRSRDGPPRPAHWTPVLTCKPLPRCPSFDSSRPSSGSRGTPRGPRGAKQAEGLCLAPWLSSSHFRVLPADLFLMCRPRRPSFLQTRPQWGAL